MLISIPNGVKFREIGDKNYVVYLIFFIVISNPSQIMPNLYQYFRKCIAIEKMITITNVFKILLV